MSEFRKIHYVIIHLPTDLVAEVVRKANQMDESPTEIVLSTTDETNKNPQKIVDIETDWCQVYAKEGQTARGLELPITLTNGWRKLSKKYFVKIETYFTPLKKNEKVKLHELL